MSKPHMVSIWIVVAILILTGCEYKPRETFTIVTADGKQIRLTCPVVESARITFTYFIDGHCVIEPPAKK